MFNNKDIIKITKIKNVRIKNIHNSVLFPKQDILEIEFRNGDKRVLDLFSQHDFTDIDYFEVVFTDNTKHVVLFQENI